jgi:hypothetical protein
MAEKNPVIVSWSGDLPTSWTALAASAQVSTVDLVTPAANGDAVQIRIDGGTAQDLAAGVAFTLRAVDLSRLEVQGAASGLSLTVAGEAPGG